MPAKLTDNEMQRLIQLAEKTKWDYKLAQFENKALENINKSVRKTQSIISKKLDTIKPESVFSVDRMNSLANEMERLTAGVQAQITKDISRTTQTAGTASYAQHNKIASFNGLVPGFNNVAMSAAQMNSLVAGTKVGGKLLNEWVSHNFSKRLQDDFKAKITSGMLLGEGYPDLVKRFKTGIYDTFKNDIEGLTRTYVQSVNVNAMEAVAEANNDIIKGWYWNSVAENRTCYTCLSLDSQHTLYKIGEGPHMPYHIRCRCFKEYVTKTFRELGVDIDEIKDQYRPYTIRGSIDPVTGKIKAGKIGVGGGRIISTGRFLGTYEDYFNGVSVAVKQQILGPTRYGLWKSGKLKLADVADKAGNVRLIKELVEPKAVKSGFVPAKTIRDAENILKEATGITASYTGITDLKIADMVNKEMISLHGKTNGFKTTIIGGEQIKVIEKIVVERLGLDTMAEFRTLQRTIVLNSEAFKDIKSYKIMGTKAKKIMVNANPGAMIDHEVAHGLMNADKELYNIKNKIFKKYGSKDIVSDYSIYNADEMVSEAFVHYLDFGEISSEYGSLSKLNPIFKRILSKGVTLE